MTKNRRLDVAEKLGTLLGTLLRLVVSLCMWAAASAAQQPIHAEPVQAIASAGEPGLPAVRLDGNYFSRDGHRFIPVGANWVPAKAACNGPQNGTPKQLKPISRACMNWASIPFGWILSGHGLSHVPAITTRRHFAPLDFLISLAHRYHIYLHPESADRR